MPEVRQVGVAGQQRVRSRGQGTEGLNKVFEGIVRIPKHFCPRREAY
jgi:hypothetical protein